jgi:NADH-quinone oxidoreductase subunit K
MHLAYPAVLAAALFCVGLYGVLARRNAILMLMSIELMLNAVNINLVAFDIWLRDTLHTGQALTLFTIAVAAAEIGIGLAVVLLVYRTRGSSDVDRLRYLREPVGPGGTEEVHGADEADETDETDEAEVAAASPELTRHQGPDQIRDPKKPDPNRNRTQDPDRNRNRNLKPNQSEHPRPQPGGRHTA